MEIPYTVEAAARHRPDQRQARHLAVPGLGGDAVRRAVRDATSCCASARRAGRAGATILNVPLATFNTVVLISLERDDGHGLGVAEAQRLRHASGCTWASTILLRVRLPGDQVLRVHAPSSTHGYFPATNTFLAIYFTLTGLHGLHVIGGMVGERVSLGPRRRSCGRRTRSSSPTASRTPGLFWHFVDLVWIFLFPILYLL